MDASKKNCCNCAYELTQNDKEPCCTCNQTFLKTAKFYTQWKPKINETAPDNNYDQHYISTHQPIEVMQANMTHDEFIGFLKGNIIKYVCRLGKKDEPAKEAAKIRRYAEWLEQAVNGQTVDPRK